MDIWGPRLLVIMASRRLRGEPAKPCEGAGWRAGVVGVEKGAKTGPGLSLARKRDEVR